jgi:hypothetical protein
MFTAEFTGTLLISLLFRSRSSCLAMLDWSLVTTAWRVLRLRMEKTPSNYGGKLRIY